MSLTGLHLQRTKSVIWPKRTCMVWSLPTSSALSLSKWFPVFSVVSKLANIHCLKHAMLWLPRKASLPNHLHSTYLLILVSQLEQNLLRKACQQFSRLCNWVTSKRALNDIYFLVFRLLGIYPQCTHTFCVWPPEWRSDGMYFQGLVITHCHLHLVCVYTVFLFDYLLWRKQSFMLWPAQTRSLLPRAK